MPCVRGNLFYSPDRSCIPAGIAVLLRDERRIPACGVHMDRATGPDMIKRGIEHQGGVEMTHDDPVIGTGEEFPAVPKPGKNSVLQVVFIDISEKVAVGN